LVIVHHHGKASRFLREAGLDGWNDGDGLTANDGRAGSSTRHTPQSGEEEAGASQVAGGLSPG
jgi:hypothetical protein